MLKGIESGMVAKTKMQRTAPNCVTPSAAIEKKPNKGMNIRAGTKNIA